MTSKVTCGFEAINEDSEPEGADEEEAQTFASQLQKLREGYNAGMRCLAEEREEEALLYFDRVLEHPTSLDVRRSLPPEADPQHVLLMICQATLKLKGEMLKERDPLEGFACLKEAYKMESSDIVLCRRLGVLALEVGYVAFARQILECALRERPDYMPIREPLIEVCLEVQEYEAAVSHAQALLAHIPGHRRAQELLQLAAQGDVLLQPRICRRVNWEVPPENKIYRTVPSQSWTELIQIVAEILGGSCRVQMASSDDTGFVIQSLNRDWETLAAAHIICRELPASVADQEMTDQSEDPRLSPEAEVEPIELSCFSLCPVQEVPTRFPLRSRVSASKSEEQKTWNVIQLVQSAFPSADWESLPFFEMVAGPSTPPTGDVQNSRLQILEFFRELDTADVITPLSLATVLLEYRLRDPIQLEVGEAVELCALDGLIQFDSSPAYSLAMGELLFDLFPSSTDAERSSEPVKREERVLQRCQRHLSKCIGHNFRLSTEEKTAEVPPVDHRFQVRLFWTLGRLQLMEERCREAEKAFETAQFHMSNLEDALHLPYLKKDSTISLQTIQAKLLTCLYHDMIDTLPGNDDEPLNREQYEDMCTLLSPVLFGKSAVLMWDYRFRGLSFLQELSMRMESADLEFLCRLHLLDMTLSEAAVDLKALDSHGAPISELPSAMKPSVEKLPPKATFKQIGHFILFLLHHFRRHPLTLDLSEILPCLKKSSIQKLLQRVLVKSIQHLEWCFWRFSFKKEADVSASRTEHRRRALHEAAALVFALTQLDPIFSFNAEIMGNLALDLFDLMAERGAVYLGRSSVKSIALHLLADRFAAWMDFFARIDGLDAPVVSPMDKKLLDLNVEGKEDIKNSVEALVDGISHFVHCLYGIDFVMSAASDWNDRWSREVDEGDVPQREQLPQIWRYLAPCLDYLQSREQEIRAFAKLRHLFLMLMELVTPPPPDVLTRLSLGPVFDVSDVAIDEALDRDTLPALLKDRIDQRQVGVEGIQNLHIYENLYYYYALATIEEDADLEAGDGILGEKGLELLENHLQHMKMDLCFNPDRYWTWECLAINFKNTTESFISACIQNVPPAEFRASQTLKSTWTALLAGQQRCFKVAHVLAGHPEYGEEQRYVQEMQVELDWILLTSPPPFHVWEHHGLYSREENQQIAIRIRDRLEGLVTGSATPSWEVLLHRGKICWKLQEENWQRRSLQYFARSAEASLRDEGGLIDPIYKLHASRLKLMRMGYQDWTVLQEHMFDPSHSSQMSTSELVVFEDCRAALEFCRMKMSGYHRLHYQLARSFCDRGNFRGAMSHIQQLFLKGKKKFCVGLTPIDPRQCRPSQKAATGQTSWMKISRSGAEERPWKFAKRVRKYLNLYLRLLYLTRDIDTITIVTDALTKGDFDGPSEIRSENQENIRFPCLENMAQRAMGVKLLLIHDSAHSMISVDAAGDIETNVQSILNILFNTGAMGDANYLSVSHILGQYIKGATYALKGVTNFTPAIFSAALEMLCEFQGNLKTAPLVEALERALPDFSDSELQSREPLRMLEFIMMCGAVYPMLVLKEGDPFLAAKLASLAQHRNLKLSSPICKNLLQRIVFAVIQALFARAEDIRMSAESITGDTSATDALIIDIMQRTSSVIRHFAEALDSSRFLAIRLMHLMQDLYHSMCITHGSEMTLSLQPHVPLKSQSQSIGAAIQEISKMTKTPATCIDLTGEEGTRVEEAAQQKPEAPKTEEVPNLQQQGEPVQQIEPEREPELQQGAFFSAFNQYMAPDQDSDG